MNRQEQRARSLRRILAAEDQRLRVEKWRQVRRERRLAEIEASERELLSGLGQDRAIPGALLGNVARRLADLGREANQVRREMEAEARRIAQLAARAKCAERMSQSLEAHGRSVETRSELMDIAEQWLSRRMTRSR